MKKLLDKVKSPDFKAVVKSYIRAVLAAAATMAIALLTDMAPEYAVLIGAIAAPIAKWADRAETEFGRKFDETVEEDTL